MQIKEDEMGGHVTHMGRKGMRADFWWGNIKERDHLVDLCVGEMIILKWSVKKYDRMT
jgi:hypothetical protein